MPAPQAIAQAATTVPLPVVVPPVVAPPPVLPKADWEPPPDFRKPKSPGLRWALVGLVLGGAVLAGWYFTMGPGASGTFDGGEKGTPEPPPTAEPVKVEPSAVPTAPAAPTETAQAAGGTTAVQTAAPTASATASAKGTAATTAKPKVVRPSDDSAFGTSPKFGPK